VGAPVGSGRPFPADCRRFVVPPPGPLVLSASTAAVLGRYPDPVALLTDPEVERAAAFRRPEDRNDFVAAHILVRVCAGRVLGRAPSEVTVVQRCPTCGRPHGRPFLPGEPELRISLAHTSGHVSAAAGPQSVGVDVEVGGRVALDDALMTASLAPAERVAIDRAEDPARAFLHHWVRKEALVKVGVLTLDAFASIDLSALPVPRAAGAVSGPRWSPAAGASLLDWIDGDVVGAVAFRGRTGAA
jgi:4'-phosphopantetheinyl transferase